MDVGLFLCNSLLLQDQFLCHLGLGNGPDDLLHQGHAAVIGLVYIRLHHRCFHNCPSHPVGELARFNGLKLETKKHSMVDLPIGTVTEKEGRDGWSIPTWRSVSAAPHHPL